MSKRVQNVKRPEHRDDPDYYFDSYKEFSWKFRVWLIVYGVSIPLTVLNNDQARSAIVQSPYGIYFVKASFVAVLIQILMAFTYKCCMWNCDRNARGKLPDESFWFKSSVWITENFWLEVVADLLALTAFSTSTWKLLGVISEA